MRQRHTIGAGVALLVALILVAATPTRAQLTLPAYYPFVDGTTISADEVNSVLATIASNSLNRTAGTMTGHLLFSATNTYDIGASGATRPRTVYAGTSVVAPAFTGALTGNVTGNVSGDVTGNVLASDGSVGTPGIRWSSDTDTGFYRVGADSIAVAIGGVLRQGWTATVNTLYSNTYGAIWARANGTDGVDLHIRAAADKDGCLSFTEDTDTDRWAVRSLNDDDKLYFSSGSCASATGVASIDASDKQFQVSSVVFEGVQAVTTADAGTDITLTGTTYMVRVTQGGTSSGDEILGISGGAQGREIVVCLVDSSVGGNLQIINASGGVGASNRILLPGGSDLTVSLDECVNLIYDGVSSRWRVRL